jgi:hypothetical protein
MLFIHETDKKINLFLVLPSKALDDSSFIYFAYLLNNIFDVRSSAYESLQKATLKPSAALQ